MIYSPSRAADEKFRLVILKEMLGALNNNCPRTANEAGRMSRQLLERINTRDYTEDDRAHYKLVKMYDQRT